LSYGSAPAENKRIRSGGLLSRSGLRFPTLHRPCCSQQNPLTASPVFIIVTCPPGTRPAHTSIRTRRSSEEASFVNLHLLYENPIAGYLRNAVAVRYCAGFVVRPRFRVLELARHHAALQSGRRSAHRAASRLEALMVGRGGERPTLKVARI